MMSLEVSQKLHGMSINNEFIVLTVVCGCVKISIRFDIPPSPQTVSHFSSKALLLLSIREDD